MKKFNFLIVLIIMLSVTSVLAESVLDLWNVDSIIDPSWMDVETLWTADTAVLDPLGVDMINLNVGEIRYSSFGADSGILRIQAFFAYPPSLSNMPGFVINHGIIMDGELEMAETFSAALGCFALAISAPGHGSSTGGSAYHLPNLVWSYPDPRNNHFYQFAYATMRGITYMERLPMIDNAWLGALGFSGGANAAILASAVDDRIDFTVPIIPQTDFECDAADSGWILDVLSETEYSMGDSNTTYLQQFIAPVNYVEYLDHYSIFFLGSQDEFEPLDCANSTYGLLDSTQTRLEIVANFDHHCYYTPYGLTVDYESFDNSATFYLKILGTTNTILGLLRAGSPVPRIPTMTLEADVDSIRIEANVPVAFWATDNVKLWYSIDSAWTFQSVDMTFDLGIESLYRASFANSPQYSIDNLICFVEAKSSPAFWLTSRPYVPENMSFRLRPFPWLFFGLDIDEKPTIKPMDISITAHPNPFNSAVAISTPANARVEIFDINGKHIAEIPGGNQIWQPEISISSGVYFVRATIVNNEAIRRIIYLK